MELVCPVCQASGCEAIGICSDASLQGMARALGVHLPAMDIPRSEVFRCRSCRFEFSWPAIDPEPDFYLWLTRSGFPYPAHRWEWDECEKLIRKKIGSKNTAGKTGDSRLTVLDFGAGDGKFMDQLRAIEGLRVVGMDHNPDVVAACCAQGLEVMESTLDVEVFREIFPEGVFMATFWHVVEHVSDPVGLLAQAKNILSPNGMLCFSVPLTPMSYEHSWPDPFNAPPHHLSRWNMDSLHALADRLDMRADIHLPAADSVFSRMLRALVLQAAPPFAGLGRWGKASALLGLILHNPGVLAKEFRHQLGHPEFHGKTLPDVAMVVLENWRNS